MKKRGASERFAAGEKLNMKTTSGKLLILTTTELSPPRTKLCRTLQNKTRTLTRLQDQNSREARTGVMTEKCISMSWIW